MKTREQVVKEITGKIMRSPMVSAEQAAEAGGNKGKLARMMVENIVRSTLAYRHGDEE